jgi:hypothetical protein
MAVADMFVLCSGLVPDWVEAVTLGRIVPKQLHPVTCKIEKFVFYTRFDIISLSVFLASCFFTFYEQNNVRNITGPDSSFIIFSFYR